MSSQPEILNIITQTLAAIDPQILNDLVNKVQVIKQYGQQAPIENIQDYVSKLENHIESQFNALKEKEQQLIVTPLRPKKVPRMYVDGCFDLMHSGHFNALRQAKQYAETLVVGVISHEEVCKRKGTPILEYAERLMLAKSCKWVDEIYEHAPYDATIELLDQLNCTHTAHGDDMIITPDGKDAFKPFKDAGRMIVFKRTEGISTTDVVGRLLLMTRGNQDKSFKKKLRKQSGDTGLKASNLQDSSSEEEKEQQQNEKLEEQQKQELMHVTNVKMLNTTRRIRQFSSDHKEPKEGSKIIYIDGSFDLLHIGHIKALETAKKEGNYLIVGIHDDETVNQIKGNNYPVLQLQERVLNVLAMKFVDEVIIGAPYVVTEQMIKQFNIDLVVEGAETLDQQPFNEQIPNDPYAVAKKMNIFKTVQSSSTMNIDIIIERIFKNRMQYLEIYNKKAKKQQNYYDTTERAVKEC